MAKAEAEPNTAALETLLLNHLPGDKQIRLVFCHLTHGFSVQFPLDRTLYPTTIKRSERLVLALRCKCPGTVATEDRAGIVISDYVAGTAR